MGRKTGPRTPARIPQGRAPALPKAGQVTQDNPVTPSVGEPQTDGPQTPSQIDPRSPMETGEAPTRLDFERLKYRVAVQGAMLRRLLKILPAGEQGAFAPLLEEVETE